MRLPVMPRVVMVLGRVICDHDLAPGQVVAGLDGDLTTVACDITLQAPFKAGGILELSD